MKKMRRTRFNNRSKTVTDIQTKPLRKTTKKTTETDIPEITDIKEILFATEYLTDLDPIGAGLRTGMISMRLQTKIQKKQAQQIFMRPSIQQYIKQGLQDRLARVGITEDKILREVGNIAFFDMADLLSDTGEIKQMHDIPKEVRAAIQEMEYKVTYTQIDGMKITTGSVTKVKMYDKLNSLKTLLSQINGQTENNTNVNYTQYNIGNTTTHNKTTNNVARIDMSDFSDIELKVIRKMSGNQDPSELIELQELEAAYFASPTA